MTRHIANTDNGGPPIDDVPHIDAIGRMRWAIMDPRNPLSPTQRGLAHVIVCHIDYFGDGVKLAYNTLAECAGLPNRESARYHMEGVLKWIGFRTCRKTDRSAYQFYTNISPEQHIEIYVAALKRKGRSVRPSLTPGAQSVSPSLTNELSVSPSLTNGSADNQSVRLDPQSVRLGVESVRPGTPPNTNTNKASKQAEQDCSKNVVPLHDQVDVDLNTDKLAKFGSVERGRLIVERFAGAVGKPTEEVLDQLHYDGGIHGYENVRIAVDSTADKNPDTPAAWYRKVLNGEASKNPGLQPPKQAEEPKVRRLSMAERSFRC